MNCIIFVIVGRTAVVESVKKLARLENAKVVLMGLAGKQDGPEKRRDRWQTLFEVQEEMRNAQIEVALCTREGDVSEVVAAAQTMDISLCVLPKGKVLELDWSQFEDLVASMSCPLLLY